MISYELAKQLKDAGFPQNTFKEGYFLWNRGERERAINTSRIGDFPHKQETVYIPTLAELIEACGDDYGFGQLYRIGTKGNFSFHAETNIELILQTSGSTPEEAVAKLWLELNRCIAREKKDGRMHTCEKYR